MKDVRYSAVKGKKDRSKGAEMSALVRILLLLLVTVSFISGGILAPGVGTAQAKEWGLFAKEIVKFFRNGDDREHKGGNNRTSDQEFQKYEGFMVYIAGERAVKKIVLLDIALEIEMSDAQKATHQREIRKIIYRTSKEMLSGRARFPHVQKGLKQEIESRVNRWMRRPCVKGVYITRFMVL